MVTTDDVEEALDQDILVAVKIGLIAGKSLNFNPLFSNYSVWTNGERMLLSPSAREAIDLYNSIST